MSRVMTSITQWIGPAAAAAILLGVSTSIHSRQPTGRIKDYHERIKLAAFSVPLLIGEWHGEDTPVSTPAIKILKPNVMISRIYKNPRTSQQVRLLLVQTADAWNMNYHWPPHCYKHSGFSTLDTEQYDWPIASLGQSVPVKIYHFDKPRLGGSERLYVHNFMFMSTGLATDNQAIDQVAKDPERRLLGSAQIQIAMPDSITLEERQKIFTTLVEGCSPVIDQVLKGVKP